MAERGKPKGNVEFSCLLHSRILTRVKRHLRCDRLKRSECGYGVRIIKSGLAQSVERLFYKTPGHRFRPQWFFSAFFFLLFSFIIVILNYCKVDCDVSVPAIAISDHYPICFTRSTSRKQFKRQAHKTVQYRCYAKVGEERFHQDLSREIAVINISCESENININFENWTSAFMKIFNKHAPLKSKRVKREAQPECHNDEIKLARKKRDVSRRLKTGKNTKLGEIRQFP